MIDTVDKMYEGIRLRDLRDALRARYAYADGSGNHEVYLLLVKAVGAVNEAISIMDGKDMS